MIEVKLMEIRDLPEVVEIEKEIFSIPWSLKSFQESLINKNTLYMVAVENEKVIGYAGMYISFEEGDISNVAVASNYRKRGVATKLLLEIIRRAHEKGVTDVTLEVRETNVGAIRLYEKLGFKEVGIRKNFYEKPIENALIMWKHNQ